MQLPWASDLITQYLPWYFITSNYLKNFEIPHWVPGIYEIGYPLFAEGQTGALSPINSLILFLFPFSIAVYLLYATYLLITFSGVYIFLKSKNLDSISAIFGSLTFCFSGFFLSRYFQPDIIFTSSLLPWGLYTVEKSKTSVISLFLLPAVIFLQITAGHLQMVFVCICAYFFYATLNLKNKDGFQLLLKTISVITLGLTLSAPQLLTSRDLYKLSERQNWDPQIRYSYSLPPTHLITYVYPNAFGISKPGNDYGFRQFGGGFWELNLTIWTLPFVFSLMPLIRLKQMNKFVLKLYIMWLLFLLLSFGGFFKFYRIISLIEDFPFRVPARFLLIATFSASCLAAYGFYSLFKERTQLFKTIALLLIFLLTSLQIFLQMKNYFIFKHSHEVHKLLSTIPKYTLNTALPLKADIDTKIYFNNDYNYFKEVFDKGVLISATTTVFIFIWLIAEIRLSSKKRSVRFKQTKRH